MNVLKLFSMIECPDCGWLLIPENKLPLVLRDGQSYEATETGEIPLANVEEWVNVPCSKCDKMIRGETDTMSNLAKSS